MYCEGASTECPYVSPIKFATDESDVSNESLENVKRKKSVQSRKYRKIYGNKPLSTKKARTWTKIRYSDTKYSENWQPFCNHSIDNQTETKKIRRASEPWRSVAKLYTSKEELGQISSSSSSIWPDFLQDKTSKHSRKHRCCCYHKRAVNPMLKIAQYIDSILKDIDDSKHDM